jgi:CBS domain-containing protein
MATKVSAVLRHKGHQVVTVAPDQTIAAVARVLTVNRIGAAPVINAEGRLVGIISERDIVRGLSENGATTLTLPAERLMTREVRTCSTEDLLDEIMSVMTNQRVRHLPVVQNGAIDGNCQHRRCCHAASRRGPVRGPSCADMCPLKTQTDPDITERLLVESVISGQSAALGVAAPGTACVVVIRSSRGLYALGLKRCSERPFGLVRRVESEVKPFNPS